MKTTLILGRTTAVLDQVEVGLPAGDYQLLAGTSLDDVRRVFAGGPVDTVIMGAGLDLALRLEVVEFIFGASSSTTVHMKDWDSGPAGMLPFVQGVLAI
jgi:hypothetical protein